MWPQLGHGPVVAQKGPIPMHTAIDVSKDLVFKLRLDAPFVQWRGEYAMTSLGEYWAEGSQFWFNSNRLAVMSGRRVLNADDLARYDPALYRALGRAYGPGHRLPGDPFWMSEARVPPGPIPRNTAEVC